MIGDVRDDRPLDDPADDPRPSDGPGPVGAPGDVDGEPARPTPRALVMSFGMLAIAVLTGVLVVLPAPYAVNGPGPTKDVLGEVDGEP